MTGKTPGQIRAAIGRAVLKADPAAARRRREEAEKDPRVELWREDAGTAAICGYGLPADAALAAGQAITTAAMELKAACLAGTMDQLRARAYLDALLGKDSRPAPASTAAHHHAARQRGNPQRGNPQRRARQYGPRQPTETPSAGPAQYGARQARKPPAPAPASTGPACRRGPVLAQ